MENVAAVPEPHGRVPGGGTAAPSKAAPPRGGREPYVTNPGLKRLMPVRPLCALALLSAAAAASALGFPAAADLGPFALGAGGAAILLRNRPLLLMLMLIPAAAVAVFKRFSGGLAPGLAAVAEASAIILFVGIFAWRFKLARAKEEASMNALEATIDELRAISVRDPLTNLYNRRFVMESGRGFAAMNRRYGNELHLIMLDLDHFKRINDSYGHAAGDEVLKGLAEVLRGIVRQSDVAARIGGEEFLILLPQTGAEAAYNIANRIRDAVAAASFSGVPRKVTVSLGVVGLKADESFEAALERADACLYQSKHSGRNRVTVG